MILHVFGGHFVFVLFVATVKFGKIKKARFLDLLAEFLFQKLKLIMIKRNAISISQRHYLSQKKNYFYCYGPGTFTYICMLYFVTAIMS